MAYRHIEVTRLAGGCGAEVAGVDLAQPLDAAVVGEIRRAIVDNLVLFFRGQAGMRDADQVRFASYFGSFGRDPFVEGEETHPNVIKVAKEADEGAKPTFGGNWHSDWSFLPTPPAFTLLHARELPPHGGDTLFANQYLAYETLSDGLRRTLDSLRAVYWAKAYAQGGAFHDNSNARSMKVRHDPSDMVETLHPVVRVHPESQRRALYVNTAYTVRFEGMTEHESQPLLEFLYDHAVRPEFTCRFAWSPGALAMWDNRCLQHFAINDYSGHRRELRRTTVLGEAPIPFSAAPA
ncbi:TauD/TfdA dioxygenase family protein [Vineibacter terrae]|uniref:TauD/TfdA dioxygenase family protein n=1 Tax=Vineibacter terrae TaxID=2586908 RepID=UPI002E36E01E|nr:TauD/TfdA family dioxygenase [Vineibacter terrae]HEX2891245.1 TauD/TfdA family dioxygenase [Vineibacter terrae]